MRGGQWEEGRGHGIGLERVLAVIAVAVVLGALAVYLYGGGQPAPVVGAVTTITTTGVKCDADSLPQGAAAVENDPRYASLSGGRCYNYMGEASSGLVSVLTFDYYNGTVVYECGTTAYDLVASQILANVTSSGALSSLSARSEGLNPAPPCPAETPVLVVSVEDVGSLIPAVPQLNITLEASPAGQAVTSLRATVTLVGSSQQFVFVAHAALAPGRQVSDTQIVSPTSPLSAGVLYPMRVTGTLASGQAFSFQAYVQVGEIP